MAIRPVPDFSDLLGLPFLRGGRGPDAYDCYGLVIELYRRNGITIRDFKTPGTLEQIADVMVSELQMGWKKCAIGTVGALLTFRIDGSDAHVGFHIGNDRFIHALDGEGVTTERLSNNHRLRVLASYVYE